MASEYLRLLVLGAHPDDAEFHSGGLIWRYRDLGHAVRIVSVTNGAAGHQTMPAEELAAARRGEAAEVSRLCGAEYDIWDYPDAHLQLTLDLRHRIIREVRTYQPDLVLTHRTCDYHPDHRAVGQAVQDASFLLTVPRVVPEVAALRKVPVVACMTDLFTRPCPMRGDVVIDIAPVFSRIVDLLDCHRSQVYEWLPYLMGTLDQLPHDPGRRKALLGELFAARARSIADRFRDDLVRTYGEAGRRVELAEAYEISEYAAPLDDAARSRCFPFLPAPMHK